MDEFDLLCRLLVEDSIWLDKFQTAVLRSLPEISPLACEVADEMIVGRLEDQTNMIPESEATSLRQRAAQAFSVNQDCRENIGALNPQHTLNIDSAKLGDLPAPEFVRGTRSCVQSETFRLWMRSASISKSEEISILHKTVI